MWMDQMWKRGLVVMMAAATLGLTACDDSDNDSDSDDSPAATSVVGTWSFNDAPDGSGGWNSWWVFQPDGRFIMYDDPGLKAFHLDGTYQQDGLKVTGDFVNPRVGTGEIDATLNAQGTRMELDFIEHWHTPYKHVPLYGTRVK